MKMEFVRFAIAHAEDTSKIICPCLECCYTDVSANVLEDHLICNGIDKSYTCWIMHGEKKPSPQKGAMGEIHQMILKKIRIMRLIELKNLSM